MRISRRLAIGALALLAGACAARQAPPAADLGASADALVRQGCYDCLLEARQIFDAAPRPLRQDVLWRAFEVELLLALREKELALDAEDSLARARTLALALHPSTNATGYLTIVDGVAPDASGTPRRERQPEPPVAGRLSFIDELTTQLAASAFSGHVRAYLTLAVQCGLGAAPSPGARAAMGDTPLVAYRAATCLAADADALEGLRAADPAFVEAAFFLGRDGMATLAGTDGSRVRRHLEDAYARFPQSPSVTVLLASMHQALGDCRAAERYYGETLALRPAHEDARLGRAICRTYLADHSGAIADASVLVDERTYNRADGYYWRAWNQRQLKDLPAARADIDAARGLMYNARVLTLAGMIEHDQQEFDSARTDLTRARDMDDRECTARWYLGLVGFALEAWDESASGFADAAECYTRLIAETEAMRAAMEGRTDLDPAFRERQLAGFDTAIAEDRTQQSAAELNAAINYARAGDVERATVYMKRAASDPERRLVVEDLRQVLGVPRW